MASNRWTPSQKSTVQVVTITVTGYDAGTTYSLTIGRVKYSVIAQGSTTATATALYTAAANSAEGEFLEITFTNPSGGVVLCTANTAGYPFTITAAVSGATGTVSQTTTTANTSPNDVNDPLNWSAGTVPVSTEDLFIDNTNVGIYWNLGSLSAVTPNSITIQQTFTGTDPTGRPTGIGLPEQNTIGTQYQEYRAQWLVLAGVTTTCNIGKGTGAGSGRIKLDFGSTAFNLVMLNSGPSGTDLPDLEPVLVIGTGNNTATIDGGTVAFAPFGTSACTLTGLNVAVGGGLNGASTPQVRCGPGTTFSTATIIQGAGNVTLYKAPTTITQQGGTLLCQVSASATITTLSIGGTFQAIGALTITTLHGWTGGTADWSLDATAMTVTNGDVSAGFSWNDPLARVTMTNAFTTNGCDAGADVNWTVGNGRTIKFA